MPATSLRIKDLNEEIIRLKNELVKELETKNALEQQRSEDLKHDKQDDLISLIDFKTIYDGDDDGPSPSIGDAVKMHYKLSSLTIKDEEGNRAVIEDSRIRYSGCDPFSFVMGKNQVIQGIELALSKMRKAEVAECILPARLAYKDESFGDSIPAGSDLHCRIELIDFGNYECLEQPLMKCATSNSRPPKAKVLI